MTKNINIALINYPKALQSAVHGLAELFTMANKIAMEQQLDKAFVVDIIQQEQLMTNAEVIFKQPFDLVIDQGNINIFCHF